MAYSRAYQQITAGRVREDEAIIVSEDKEIVADGKRILLEKGDKITINESANAAKKYKYQGKIMSKRELAMRLLGVAKEKGTQADILAGLSRLDDPELLQTYQSMAQKYEDKEWNKGRQRDLKDLKRFYIKQYGDQALDHVMEDFYDARGNESAEDIIVSMSTNSDKTNV